MKPIKVPIFEFRDLPDPLKRALMEELRANDIRCQNGGYVRFPESWDLKTCFEETNNPIIEQFLEIGVTLNDQFVIIHMDM